LRTIGRTPSVPFAVLKTKTRETIPNVYFHVTTVWTVEVVVGATGTFGATFGGGVVVRLCSVSAWIRIRDRDEQWRAIEIMLATSALLAGVFKGVSATG
jgi:hypothetical protein